MFDRMGIRSRTIALIVVVLSAFIAFSAAVSYQFVIHRFEKLEQDDVETQLATVHSEVRDNLESLETISVDWGAWDDTYVFVADRNAEYQLENLSDPALENLRVDFMLFYDIEGNLIHRKFVAPYPRGAEIEPASLLEALREAPGLLASKTYKTRTSGIVIAESSVCLVASHFIARSIPGSPVRGTLVIGRWLDDSQVKDIGEATQTRLSVYPDNGPVSATPSPGRSGDSVRSHVDIRRLDADTVLGRSQLPDLSGTKRLLLEIEVDREIYQQGVITWKQNALSMVGLGVVFIFLLLFVLDRCILNRLSALSQNVGKLSFSGEKIDRLEVRRPDELGRLAMSINNMLAELNRYHLALIDSENKYRAIVEDQNELICRLDGHWRLTFANGAFCRFFGTERDALVGKNIATVINPFPPEDLGTTPPHGARAFQTRLENAGNETRWVQWQLRWLSDKGGEATGVQLVGQDISERVAAENALRESETRYRTFFEQDLTGDVLTTADGAIVDCNPAFARMFGYESTEAVRAVNIKAFYTSARTDILDRLRREQKIERIQMAFVKRDGRPLYCIGNLVGQFDPEGNLTHISTYFFDDTKRVLLEKDLRKAQKMEAIGTLAGGIAHDFNNLLQPILGYAHILQQDLPVEDPQREYADRIMNAGRRAKDLVKQILAFSRKSEHRMIAVHLQQVLKEVVKLCRASIPSSIRIQSDFEKECPAVMADPTQLHQVAMNLIINAYHAVEQTAGSISIQVKAAVVAAENFKVDPLRPGRYAVLSVSDTGCGMDGDTIDKIFEPYFTTKAPGQGTGLGLAVVYGIIKECQGDIYVHSEPGKGSTFDVYLPVAAEAVEEPDDRADENYPGGDERILVVDDESIVLEMVANMLKRLGYRVTSLQGSEEALEVFQTVPDAFDLVITDMTMPGITGDRLAEKMLSVRPEMPIILYTGYSERIGRERAREIGIRELMMKPVTIAEISEKVRKALETSPRQRVVKL